MLRLTGLLLFTLFAAGTAAGQGFVRTVATGLDAPIGLAMDAQGRLWVAEQGTGQDDGHISVVLPDGSVHPFVTGLRSVIVEGSPESAQHLRFHDGALWAAFGLGSEVPESYLLRLDTTGFSPGDAPIDAATLDPIDIGSFVLAQGIAETSVYNLAFTDDGDAMLVDASGNALLRRDGATGELSVVATFPPVPNPIQQPGLPPVIQAVPTSIVGDGAGGFYVSQLTGFPFVDGLAKVYHVDAAGAVTVVHEGLTLVVDLAVDPRDGALVVLEFGRFSLETFGFVEGSGQVLKLHAGHVDTLAAGLTAPAGMAFDVDGDLFVAANFEGKILRIDAARTVPTGVTPGPAADVPQAIRLYPNYPNPFNPATTLAYEVAQAGRVVLKVFDVLGREVQTLVDDVQAPGRYRVTWDSRAAGTLASGMYLYRLQAAGQVQTRAMLLVK